MTKTKPRAVLLTTRIGGKQYRPFYIAILFFLTLSACSTSAPAQSNQVKLLSIIDGDTIRVRLADGSEQKVRLLSIDTPEMDACFGPEARTALAQLIDDQKIRLDKDVDATDKYDRLLRYVIVENRNETEDNILVNEWLVRQGFAFRYNSPPNNRYRELLVRAEEEARKEKRGMWGECDYLESHEKENAALRESDSEPPNKDCIIKGNISEKGFGKTYLIPGCDNYERTKIDTRKGEAWFCSETEAKTAGFRKATNCPQ